MNKNIKYFIPLIVVFILWIIIKLVTPRPIDWSDSFSRNDKIPFGGYILYELLPGIFNNNKIHEINFPIYNVVKNKNFTDKNYIIVTNRFDPDDLDIEYLLDFIEADNNLFISSLHFGKRFSDELNIEFTYQFFASDSSSASFKNEILNEGDEYKFRTSGISSAIQSFDSSKVVVLGTDDKSLADFIHLNYGKGSIFIHTSPHIFTNYNILSDNARNASKYLSYLPSNDVFWDEYYKEVNKYNSTPVRYILSNNELSWSYYTLILSLIIFVLFKGKRTQRIIPVINPYSNTTIEFVETIGNLYFRQRNHKNIAEKKITYLLDYLRTKYAFNLNISDVNAVDILSVKTNYSREKCIELISAIRQVKRSMKINEAALLELNNVIENFYNHTGSYGK